MACAYNGILDETRPRIMRGSPAAHAPDDRWWRPSVLPEELLCRLHRLRAEVVVPDAGKSHETLGRVDQAVEPLRQRHRHDIVAVAVQHQHRGRDLADARV